MILTKKKMGKMGKMVTRSRTRDRSQYYTTEDAWESLIADLHKYVPNMVELTKVDPCAGYGVLRKFFPDMQMFDLDPKADDVQEADAITLDFSQVKGPVMVITSIPFNARDRPIAMMNAWAAYENVNVIAIMNASKYEYCPKDSYDRSGTEFNKQFHCIHSTPVSGDKFTPLVYCQTSFQIWVRKPFIRKIPQVPFKMDIPSRSHNPDFYMHYGGVTAAKDFVRRPGWSYVACRIHKSLRNKFTAAWQLDKLIRFERKVRKNYRHGNQGFHAGHVLAVQAHDLKCVVD